MTLKRKRPTPPRTRSINRPRWERNMDSLTEEKSAGQCPVAHGKFRSNRDWWPNQLDIQVLHQHSSRSDPMGEAFDYAKEFESLDLNSVIKDLEALMTDSQAWW